MRRGALTRAVWSVSIPIIFAELSETVVHVTDTLFLARVGIVEAGAIALADTIFEIGIVLTIGLVEGIQILIARRVGEGRDRAVGRVFTQGLLLLTGVSLVLTALLLFGAPRLAGFLVASADVTREVNAYLRVIAWSVVFSSANLVYSALFVGLGRTRILIWATVVLALTNVGLDAVLIFGHLGFPALGMTGAAIGSLGAEIVTFAFLTVYVLRRLDVRRYGLFRLRRWDGRLHALTVRISLPVSMQALLEGLRWFLFFLMVERIGETALALSNLVYSCYAVLRIPTEGFAETACSMVSSLIGRGQASRIGQLMREVIRPAYLVTIPLLIPIVLFPEFILSLLTSEPELVRAGGSSLRVIAVAMLVVIPAEMWFVAVSGTGDTDAALLIEGILTGIMLLAGYLAAFVLRGEVALIWTSVPAAWLACLLLSWAWIRMGRWRRVRI